MPLYVGKNLSGRLLYKLLLKAQQTPGDFPLVPQVVPVTSIDTILADLVMKVSPATDVSAASGATRLLLVPANKVWVLHIVQRPATTGTSQTYLLDDRLQSLSLDAPSSAQSRILLPQPVRMKPGWGLYMLNTNNVLDIAAEMTALVSEEDAS